MPDPFTNFDLFTKTVYTFATLPPANISQGNIQWISDSTKGGFVDRGAIAVGGGGYKCKVVSDGTNWRIDG